MVDTYNGWSNRETWAVNLHLSNDHGLYLSTLDVVREAVAAEPDREPVRAAADALQEWVERLVDPDEELLPRDYLVTFLHDVGSLYRVDWDEIAPHWLDSDD